MLMPSFPSFRRRSRRGKVVASRPARQWHAAYHYRDNGCAAGDALAQLFDGTSKRVADVVKGDVLVDALTNGPAVVRCVVRTRMLDPALRRGRVRATAWHPCMAPGGDRWSFPAEVTMPVVDRRRLRLQPVRGPSDRLPLGRWDGVIGLGHGITDDSVASHPFFGTARVIDAARTARLLRGTGEALDGAYVRAAGNRYISAIDPDRVVGTASRTVPTMMAVEAPLVAANARKHARISFHLSFLPLRCPPRRTRSAYSSRPNPAGRAMMGTSRRMKR